MLKSGILYAILGSCPFDPASGIRARHIVWCMDNCDDVGVVIWMNMTANMPVRSEPTVVPSRNCQGIQSTAGDKGYN